MAEITVTAQNFDEVISGGKPVLVDFWASWCGPCRMLAPVIEELASELEGECVVGKVNVDDFPELAERFGIISIPTVLLFKDGVLTEKVIGIRPKSFYEGLVR